MADEEVVVAPPRVRGRPFPKKEDRTAEQLAVLVPVQITSETAIEVARKSAIIRGQSKRFKALYDEYVSDLIARGYEVNPLVVVSEIMLNGETERIRLDAAKILLDTLVPKQIAAKVEHRDADRAVDTDVLRKRVQGALAEFVPALQAAQENPNG